jgi:hypothetical protein
MARVVNGVKYYPVSERWLFGLESMRDKCTYWLTCEYENFTDAQIEEIEALQEECESLLWKVRSGWADGKTFGRMKEITYQREQIRFNTCIENGMPYEKAVQALSGN